MQNAGCVESIGRRSGYSRSHCILGALTATNENAPPQPMNALPEDVQLSRCCREQHDIGSNPSTTFRSHAPTSTARDHASGVEVQP